MAVFDFLKKKKAKKLPLPPPPSPPGKVQGDFEPIRPAAPKESPELPEPPQLQGSQGMPQFPEMPLTQSEPFDFPELPELPEAPGPGVPRMPNTPQSPRMEAPMPPAPRTPPLAPEPARSFEPHDQPDFESVPEHRAIPARSFVSIDDYKKIVSETNNIRSRLVNADNYVKKLSDLRQGEERALKMWHEQLEKVEKKLSYVDELIASAKR